MDVIRLACRWLAPAPAVAVYAFGKHRGFADFVDVARLPPVPAGFRHVHDVLRPAVEGDGGPAVAMWIAWHDRGTAAVLRVQPSRDRGDAITGRFRRCPLLLGVSARSPLPALLRFAGSRLATLAETAVASEGEAMLRAVGGAAAAWPAQWPAAGDAAVVAPMIDAVGERTPIVAVAGPGGVVTEAARLSDTSATTLGDLIGHATARLR